MTERRAQAQGLSFTGTYKRSYEVGAVKAKAKDIRKQGFRAVIVTEPGGYSVFAEQAYFDHLEIEKHQSWLEATPALGLAMERRHAAEVEELRAKIAQVLERIAELKAKKV